MTILFRVWSWTSYSGLQSIAKRITKFGILRAIFQEEAWNLDKWLHFFIYCLSSICLEQWFLHLKIVKVFLSMVTLQNTWIFLTKIAVLDSLSFFSIKTPWGYWKCILCFSFQGGLKSQFLMVASSWNLCAVCWFWYEWNQRC